MGLSDKDSIFVKILKLEMKSVCHVSFPFTVMQQHCHMEFCQ